MRADGTVSKVHIGPDVVISAVGLEDLVAAAFAMHCADVATLKGSDDTGRRTFHN